MKKLKRILRLFCLALLLLLAVTGIAITGAAPTQPKNRQKIIDNETLIEMVDQKKDDDEEKP
ncbi:hypothetical protein SNE25_14940 [Mucilaginibacter sabulilitoris]|uniref:Secreted protein n=1 Tax=Mucilaginibacter sabulilitoris TaxID=1173583 RepID=A0ABZ0TWE6_9SPHI|nr:hypothetical protein [Mucilaginibacter sabulilitoris]WPU96817.1 hypothetical protein SNE25_14940 [Mucilaginibacter sabulilitoris]